MKLLLDENLSRRAVPFLQDAFPGSTQVPCLAWKTPTIWRYAKVNDFKSCHFLP
jgi:predicted nuclease of predicted toxin-antitoxin system